MPDDPTANLPAPIASALTNISQALVPSSIKALNRLLGAAVEVPAAWLERQKAKIEARTRSLTGVEDAIGKAAATKAGDDQEVSDRAIEALLSKTYRKQENREAVGRATVEELASSSEDQAAQTPPTSDIDDDWLNVFERYAEDASSERMQRLWGRVLAGEIRRPGQYSLRTLRFLSEFSQQDALAFADLAAMAFNDLIPAVLVKPTGEADITLLINLEAAGVIQGASGLGLTKSLILDERGNGFIAENNLLIQFVGAAGTKLAFSSIVLTPLGKELLSLVPGRNPRDAARKVALALREPNIKACHLAVMSPDRRLAHSFEMIWTDGQNV